MISAEADYHRGMTNGVHDQTGSEYEWIEDDMLGAVTAA